MIFEMKKKTQLKKLKLEVRVLSNILFCYAVQNYTKFNEYLTKHHTTPYSQNGMWYEVVSKFNYNVSNCSNKNWMCV